MSLHSGNETNELTFHNACAEGDLSAVKDFLSQPGFDMNFGDYYHERTGFHLACQNGQLNVVQFLVQQGFDMNALDRYERTGFHSACISGKLGVVRFLVRQGFDMNVGDNNGRTGFHLACLNGHLNMVQFFIQEGYDMTVGDNNGSIGFHDACCQGHLNVVQFLLQEGFDMNVVANDGCTGFNYACFSGQLHVVQFLLQEGFVGINGHNFDEGGTTVLNMLIEQLRDFSDDKPYMQCILLLIEYGAQLDQNDVFEELTSAIKNRIIEITFMKEIIFEKWTGRIAQAITDFTMDPFTNTSLQNLFQVLD